MNLKLTHRNLPIEKVINDMTKIGEKLEEIRPNIPIEQKKLKKIYKILNSNDLKNVCNKIGNGDYLEKFEYEDLNYAYETLKEFFRSIKTIKEEVDIEIFFKTGAVIDIKLLKRKFKMMGKDKEFPNFNFKRLEQLFRKPPVELLPPDDSSDKPMKFDPFVVRKYLYAIIQMVVNEMDLLVGFVGGEGMGKSCACSQDMALMYYLLKELGLIKYRYNIKDMWFNSLEDFISAEDEHFDEKFRILSLDEGNELNRQDWQNETVKTFFQRLRRERYNQRIKFICLPQLSELMTAIVVSRMNFIFSMKSKNDIRTGTIEKGFCEMYIIPRNEVIYSPALNKNLYRDEIKQQLTENLDNKRVKYINQIPKTLIIKSYRKNGVWGFSHKLYIKHLKQTNKTFTVSKGVRLTEYQCYCYFVTRPNIAEWHLDKKEDKEIYATLAKMDRSICKQFDENPNKREKYDKLIKLKRRHKQ